MPYETGAPGFHTRGPGIHHNSSVLRGERLKSAPAPCHVALFHSSIMSNAAHTKPPPPSPPVPSLGLFAITEGDVIAWHDEIVHVSVHFIQAKRA